MRNGYGTRTGLFTVQFQYQPVGVQETQLKRVRSSDIPNTMQERHKTFGLSIFILYKMNMAKLAVFNDPLHPPARVRQDNVHSSAW
jgi:hypothetical protein